MNKEKILETAMRAALHRKDYYASVQSECGDSYYEKKYQEACQECVEACERLFMHYTAGNK